MPGEEDAWALRPEFMALRAVEEGAGNLRLLYESRQRAEEQQRTVVQQAQLAEALERVKALESELRELRALREKEHKAELERLCVTIDTLRTQLAAHKKACGPSRATHGVQPAAYRLTVPGYLTRGYAEVAKVLEEADVSAALADRTKAAESRYAAAHKGCELLGRLVDDEDYHAQLRTVAALAADVDDDELRTRVSDDSTFEEIRTPTLQLLALAGIPLAEAAALVDACRADFLASAGTQWRRPAVMRRDLRRLRNAVCGEAKEGLRRNVQRSRRMDNAVPLLIKGVGGGLLAGLAGPLAGLVGEGAAAVLGAVGAAGIEAAAGKAVK